jgi:hypothetical protein
VQVRQNPNYIVGNEKKPHVKLRAFKSFNVTGGATLPPLGVDYRRGFGWMTGFIAPCIVTYFRTTGNTALWLF